MGKEKVKKEEENSNILMSHMLASEVAVFNSEISRAGLVLGEMANVLSVAMPDKKIFDNYQVILEKQNTIIKSIDETYKNISPTIENLRLANDTVNSILSPISGVIVDLGLNITNANKLYTKGFLEEKNYLNLQKISTISFDIIKEQQGILLSSLEKTKNNFGNLIDDLSMPSTSMMATGIDIATRAIPTFPSIPNFSTLEIIRKETFLDDEEINDAQEILDGMFKKIGHFELVEIRKGCWEAFHGKKNDYIRQASSSMRGLVDNLLREIAPKEKVEETTYFKNNSDGKTEKGQPTRKAKIYYAVNYDQKKAEHLKRLAKGLDEFHQNLSAWDHEPIKNEKFVYGVFIAIEGCMIQLLSEIREKD